MSPFAAYCEINLLLWNKTIVQIIFLPWKHFRKLPGASLCVLLLWPIKPSIIYYRYSNLSPVPLNTLDKNHLCILLSPSRLLPSTSKQHLARAVMETAYYIMTFPYIPFFCAFLPAWSFAGRPSTRSLAAESRMPGNTAGIPLPFLQSFLFPGISGSRGASGDKSLLLLLVSLGADVVITWSDPCFQPSEKTLPSSQKSLNPW